MSVLSNSSHDFPGFSVSEWQEIPDLYGILPFESARQVTGGLLHRLFRVETGKEAWALKILSLRAVETNAARAALERAESVAEIAARCGIPALAARRGFNGEFLQRTNGKWVLLYPWQEGKTLPPSAASSSQCFLIGSYLGALHALKIRFPLQAAPRIEAFEEGHFEALLERGEQGKAPWASAFKKGLAPLLEANRCAMRAQLALQNGWVTGHLDFDQKNVLWHDEKPTILDWESAQSIHPALELMGAGLNWAGQSAGNVEKDAFLAFLRGYGSENEVTNTDLKVACEAVLGKWLIWLEFNLRRSLEPEIRGTSEENLCHDALFHALGTTLKLHEDVPLYRDWVDLNEANWRL